MIKFPVVWESLKAYNEDKDFFTPSLPDMNEEEWVALLGRYAESHIRFHNVTQFKMAFLTINREAQEKLRSKLKINSRLRSLNEEEALYGAEIITNVATNPDTEPTTEAYEPLPYVNQQTGQKESLGIVGGLYRLKHSVGGQAYNEYLDAFRGLFRVILIDEEVVYEE